MATLHIRNVPEEVVEVLKGRANRSKHSLNTEVVETLTEAARRSRVDEILENIDRIQARLKHPPTGEQIAEGLRRDREERAEHLWQVATRPRDE